jgi:hypothetical protein
MATQILSNINTLGLFVPLDRWAVAGQEEVTNVAANHSRGEWLAVREMVRNAKGPSKNGGRGHMMVAGWFWAA